MTGLTIFDCDGVLIDSERIYNQAWSQVLGELGLHWSVTDCARRLMGRTLPDCQGIIAAALGSALPEDFLARVFAATDRLFADQGLSAVPGVAEILRHLPYRRCVASSGLIGHVRRHLDATGLLAHFEPHIFVGAMVARSKPAPDLFLFAAERMGVAAADCVVIEDSLPGVLGARAAGMRVLGYAAHHYDPAVLSAAGAELFFDMRAVPEMISRSAFGKPEARG